MLAVYTLRSLIVWPLPLLVAAVANSLTGLHLDTDEQLLERGSWPYALVAASLWLPCSPPCCCARPHSRPSRRGRWPRPRAALRRSWSLTWTRAGAARVLALALPLAALTAGMVRLVVQLALPLRPWYEPSSNRRRATSSPRITPASSPRHRRHPGHRGRDLPLTCTAFAVLHDRLRTPGELPLKRPFRVRISDRCCRHHRGRLISEDDPYLGTSHPVGLRAPVHPDRRTRPVGPEAWPVGPEAWPVGRRGAGRTRASVLLSS
ncbi:hypothetical protein NKH18_24800 [Streptomyces sp. M10(2022)]